MANFDKLIEVGTRVYNNKARINEVIDGVDYNDEASIKAFCREVFPVSGQMPSPETLWQFNTALVRIAEKEYVEPNLQQLLSVLASYESVDANASLKVYSIPVDTDIKFTMTARGSAAKLNKIGGDRKVVQTPFNIGLGITYNVLTKTDSEVRWFKEAVRKIGQAEIKYIFSKMYEMVGTASALLPEANVKDGNNSVTYKDLTDLARTIRRRTNCTPVLIGDEIFLDHFGDMMRKTDGSGVADLLSERQKEEMFNGLYTKNFGKFQGIALDNPFTDDSNSKVHFSVKEGFMVGAGDGQKPFLCTRIGGMKQKTNADIIDGEVAFWVEQELAIELLYPTRLGYVKDDIIQG